MSLGQKGSVVLHVQQGKGKNWEIIEEGIEKPIVFFTKREHAISYAKKIAYIKKGSKVIIND